MNNTPTNGARPAGAPTTNGANGTAPPVKKIVKKGAANPFGTARRPGQLVRPNGQPAPMRPNGTGPPVPQKLAVSRTTGLAANSYSGFTDPAVLAGQKKYTDYKLVATKKDLLDGLRYHVHPHLTMLS